jgi:hypothetical protein
MRPCPYSLQFRGYVSETEPNTLRARATAPGTSLVTTIGEDGLRSSFSPLADEEAVLEMRLQLADGRVDAAGTIVCGYGNVLRFRTLNPGRLGTSPDPHLQQGTLIYEVEGGDGSFAGARGRIASNFLLSDTGELTDNQFGLIFVAGGVPEHPAETT